MLSSRIDHISLVTHIVCREVDTKDVVVVNTIPFENDRDNWQQSIWFQLIAFQIA